MGNITGYMMKNMKYRICIWNIEYVWDMIFNSTCGYGAYDDELYGIRMEDITGYMMKHVWDCMEYRICIIGYGWGIWKNVWVLWDVCIYIYMYGNSSSPAGAKMTPHGGHNVCMYIHIYIYIDR